MVTRPAHQSSHFMALLDDVGLVPISLPCIDIAFVTADIQAALKSHIMIFTSANSVNGAVHNKVFPWEFSGKVAAIGHATARALTAQGITPDLVPQGHNSESLIALILEHQDIAKRNITIIRGDSGREKLHQALTDAGAHVDYIKVYQRDLPKTSKEQIENLFSAGLPDIVSITSDLGLLNLLTLLPKPFLTSVKQCPLVVNSQRCADLALARGFENTVQIATPPGDESQVTEILRLSKQL